MKATDAPSAASRRTMPAPMPLEPPVTRATLPLNDFACMCHHNPVSYLICPFWIILSRMAVQRDSFAGCPTRSFFLSLWFSQRVRPQRKVLDEPTSGLSASLKLRLLFDQFLHHLEANFARRTRDNSNLGSSRERVPHPAARRSGFQGHVAR